MVRAIQSIPHKASVLLLIVAILVIFGYALFVSLPALLGPRLAVEASTTTGVTTISGTASRVSYLFINGQEIPLEEDGSFELTRTYPPGYTDIQVIARDRFGRVITESVGVVISSP